MLKHFTATLAATTVLCGLAYGQPSPDVQMKPSVEFPHAGIAVAVPEESTYEATKSAVGVVRAVRKEGKQTIQSVVLFAFNVRRRKTAERIMNSFVADQDKSPDVRNMVVLKEAPMTVAGIKGSGRLLRYTYRDVETAAAVVGFVRERKSRSPRICYILMVESAAEAKGTLLATLAKVINTVRLIPIVSPASIEIKATAETLLDPNHGFSIRPPLGWYAKRTPAGIQLGQADYRLGGADGITVTVVREFVEAGTTTRACAEKSLIETKKKIGTGGKVTEVSQGPTKLDGRDAWQVVLRLDPTPVRGRSANAMMQIFCVQRSLCVQPPATGDGKPVEASSYTLALVSAGGDVKTATATMDRIAKGFRLIQVSAPSTAPAVEK